MDRKSPKTIDDLVRDVTESFYTQRNDALDNVFLSLQQSMLGILEAKGDNTTPLKHMGKAKLRKEGKLPISLRCPYQLLEDSKKFMEKNQFVLEREDKRLAAVEKKKKEDALKKKVKAEEKKITDAAAIAATANDVAMVDVAAAGTNLAVGTTKNVAAAGTNLAVGTTKNVAAAGTNLAVGTTKKAAKKTDPRVLRAAAAKNTVASAKKMAVAAKTPASGTRAKKLALVKKKAAKRMTESAKRSAFLLRRLENTKKRVAGRKSNITEEDLLLKPITDAEMKREMEPLGKITNKSLVNM